MSSNVPMARAILEAAATDPACPAPITAQITEALAIMTRKYNKPVAVRHVRATKEAKQRFFDWLATHDMADHTLCDISEIVFGDACGAGRISEWYQQWVEHQ